MAINVEMAVGASPEAITAAVQGLVAQDVELMAAAELAGAPYPPLYASGVHYRREPKGRERWDTIDVVYANGSGDCEDLCGIRTAELQRAGELAKAIVIRTRRNTFHVQVLRADGTIEDPSRVLLEMERTMKRKPKICLRPVGDHYIGAIDLPIEGRASVQALEIGFDPWTALQKVVHAISAIVQNPAVASVLPPQAVIAITIADRIASMSPEGLRALLRHPGSTPAQKKLAGAVVAAKERAQQDEVGFGLTDALTLAVSPAVWAAGRTAKAINDELHKKSGSPAPANGGNVRVVNRRTVRPPRARQPAQPVPTDPYGNPMVDPYGQPLPAQYPQPGYSPAYPYLPQAPYPYPYPPQYPPQYPPGWEAYQQQPQPISLDEAAAIALWGAGTFAEGSFPGYTPGYSQDYPGQPGYYDPPDW